MKLRTILLIALALVLIIGGVIVWTKYRQVRADYDAYRTLIQRGVKVAGLDVGWHTPAEAREKVFEGAARPFYRNFALRYQDEGRQLISQLRVSLESAWPTLSRRPRGIRGA